MSCQLFTKEKTRFTSKKGKSPSVLSPCWLKTTGVFTKVPRKVKGNGVNDVDSSTFRMLSSRHTKMLALKELKCVLKT